MAYDVITAKSELQGVIHGTSINKIQGLGGVFNRAARKVLADIDPQETRRVTEITSPIFDKVYQYPIPSDVKGDRIIDIRRIEGRQARDNFTNVNAVEFEAYKRTGNFSVKFDNNLKSLRIAGSGAKNPPSSGSAPASVATCDSLTSSGTWTVGGDGSSLSIDGVNFVQGEGSLRFNASGVTGTTYVENTTVPTMDLSSYWTDGCIFVYLYIPSTVVTTGVTLRIGTDNANYYSGSATVQQDGTAFKQGWNLLRFSTYSMSTTGAPDNTDIKYLRVTITDTVGTAVTGYHVDSITASLGTTYEIEYYSKYLFRDAVTGAFKETTTDDSDLINLDTDSYNIFFNVLAELTNQQIVGQPANFDIGYFANQYAADIQRYVRKYPSETLTKSIKYYRFNGPQHTGVRRRFVS